MMFFLFEWALAEVELGRWGSARCCAAQLGSIRQMSGQVSRGSAGEYQADERAGVARLSWRIILKDQV